MSAISNILSPLATTWENLTSKLAIMPERDKRALLLLSAFLLAMLGYGVYLLHSYASKVEASALATQQQFFWLRGQAGNIKADNAAQGSLEDTIQQTANMQNIQVNAVASGSSVQFSASHEQAAVLGSFLARLEEQGVTFERLTMSQQPDLSMTAEAVARF